MVIDRQMLLGIGVGLMLAATLLAAGGGRQKPPSDVEVIQRAKALGMTFPGEQRLTLEGAPEKNPDAGATLPDGVPGETTQAPPPPGKKASTVTVVVPPGATAGEVARLLRAKSLIADEDEFLRLAAGRQAEAHFLPGTYRFPSNITVRELITSLLTGPQAE
ncbi:MAG: hypothetical protein QME79_03275 [Bacillota bacterium]|nr:hypothetical protein [Bacillota bacterium]